MSDLASAIGIRADEQELVAELKAGSEQAFALLAGSIQPPDLFLDGAQPARSGGCGGCDAGSVR